MVCSVIDHIDHVSLVNGYYKCDVKRFFFKKKKRRRIGKEGATHHLIVKATYVFVLTKGLLGGLLNCLAR